MKRRIISRPIHDGAQCSVLGDGPILACTMVRDFEKDTQQLTAHVVVNSNEDYVTDYTFRILPEKEEFELNSNFFYVTTVNGYTNCPLHVFCSRTVRKNTHDVLAGN